MRRRCGRYKHIIINSGTLLYILLLLCYSVMRYALDSVWREFDSVWREGGGRCIDRGRGCALAQFCSAGLYKKLGLSFSITVVLFLLLKAGIALHAFST